MFGAIVYAVVARRHSRNTGVNEIVYYISFRFDLENVLELVSIYDAAERVTLEKLLNDGNDG